jgi:hypothetical protein
MEETNISGSVESVPETPKKKTTKKKKSTVKVETKVVVEEPKIEYRYKLDLYNARGMMKASISRSVFAEMSKKYGDVIRSIPSNKFSTADEIKVSYSNLNKRLQFQVHRSPSDIENILELLSSAGLVVKK